MNFEYIFKKSYSEYKKNFKNIFLLSLIFIGIPLILSTLIFSFYIFKNQDFYNGFINNQPTNLPIFYTSLFLGIFIVGLIYSIFYFIFGAGIVKESITGKFNFHKTINSGKNNFWKLVWFFIVVSFFLMLLFLALIIPGIIFAIYWSVAVFAYFESKKTIIESLKTSFNMVKGNWWKIFVYSVLMSILGIIVSFVLSIVIVPTELLIYISENPSANLLTINIILNVISNFLFNLITIPFFILFCKNIYLELKKRK